MPRIPLIERADMNAEQARVYDAAKQSSGIVGGPYYAYIRLPKLFEAAQNLRESLSGGPLSQREQQIVNLVVARHWNARYPWFAQVRRSLSVGIDQSVIDAINAHKTPNLTDVAREDLLHGGERIAGEQGPERRNLCRRGKDHGAGKPGGSGRLHRQFLDDLHDRRQRSASSRRPPIRRRCCNR